MRRPSLSVLIICIILMIFPACSQSPDIQAGSASFTIRISDAVSKTISSDMDTDVSHYRLSVSNDAEGESAVSSSFILPREKGSFEVRNIPGGYTYQAKAEALIDPHGNGSYIVIAEGQSSPMFITGDGAVMDIELDSLSRGDGYESGFVRIQAVLPDGFSAGSYSWTIYGLDDVVLFESGTVKASGATGALSISIDPENVLGGNEKLYQGAYLFGLSVKGTINGASAEYSGVDYMRLMPGLDAEGRVYLSYEENADLAVSVINSLGSPIDLGENDTVEEQIPGDTLDLLISPSGGFSSLDSLSVVCYMDGNSIGTAETDYAWYSHEVEGDSIALGLKGLSTIPSGDHLLTVIVLDTAAGADYSIGMKTVTFTCVGGIPIGPKDYLYTGDAYHVFTADGLYAWAEAVKERSDLGLVLEADIVMPAGDADNPNWEPVGTEDAPFEGLIDGNGYMISGLAIASSGKGSGFLGYATYDFSAQDLRIIDSDLYVLPGNEMAGILAGMMISFNGGVHPCIENCSIEGDILYSAYDPKPGNDSSSFCAGGLIGTSEISVTFRSCSYEGNIECYGRSSRYAGLAGDVRSGFVAEDCHADIEFVFGNLVSGVGGIAYYANNARFKDCTSDISIRIIDPEQEGGTREFGGIVGFCTGSSSVSVTGCRSTGSMIMNTDTGSGYNFVAGIVGRINDNTVTVSDCSSDMHIDSGDAFGYALGGIVGGPQGNKADVMIRNCSFSGKLSHSNYSSYAGGIICKTEGTVRVEDCTVSGEIEILDSSYDSGGIVSELCTGSSVEDCSFTGSFRTVDPSQKGGIAGIVEEGAYLIGCYAAGTDMKGISGIVGDNSGTVIGCYSADDISTIPGTPTGYTISSGIAGKNLNQGKIIACYHSGAFTGQNGKAAGLLRQNGPEAVMDSCYWDALGSDCILCEVYDDQSGGAGLVGCGEAIDGWTEEIASSMNEAIAAWNAGNPDYPCDYIYELTGDDGVPMKLVANAP